jgi:hypothetical protein
LATALEEVGRSWNKPPSKLDMEYHAELVKKFTDPDGDDESCKTLAYQRKKTRRALLDEHKAKQKS